uniref:Uncharacterized protein n=1 Tax=Opuntia streptacantha TaxID=393608 RepID=A0A7C8ZC62_OPUST
MGGLAGSTFSSVAKFSSPAITSPNSSPSSSIKSMFGLLKLKSLLLRTVPSILFPIVSDLTKLASSSPTPLISVSSSPSPIVLAYIERDGAVSNMLEPFFPDKNRSFFATASWIYKSNISSGWISERV